MGIGDGGASPSARLSPRQIGDGDGGASPPPGKSGTDAPSPWTPVPGQIGDGDGDGDRGVRALSGYSGRLLGS